MANTVLFRPESTMATRHFPTIHAPADIDDTLAAIRALANLHRSSSTLDEELALDAHQAGRAVYWTKCGYSNALAGILLTQANRYGLEKALLHCANNCTSSQARNTAYLLSTIIPLNNAAQSEWNAAWHADEQEQKRVNNARAQMSVPMFDGALQAAE